MGAGRLPAVSNILRVPISFFFEDLLKSSKIIDAKSHSAGYVSEFLGTNDGLALIKAFVRINDPKLRRRIVNFVRDIAGRCAES
jgi:hypothetical protein